MCSSEPAVAVLPYETKLGFRPSKLSLDELHWPLGRPSRLSQGMLADLAPYDHLLLYPKRSLHRRPGFGTKARVSLLMVEPGVVHQYHLDALRRSHTRFYRVLTWHMSLLETLPNVQFLPFGTSWISDWQTLDITKTRSVSLIASAKRDSIGHNLRHEIADWASTNLPDLELMGGGYRPFERKSDGLAPYRYSVVIENSRETNYFSEKLLDAIFCETVPIYWGCPNIAEFFDTAPMIICESAEDIKAALRSTSEQDYARRRPALQALKDTAQRYLDLETRAAKLLLAGATESPTQPV